MRKYLLAAVLTALAAGQLAHAISVDISPAAQTSSVGEPLSYDVRVLNVGAEIVTGFDIDIAYDPSLLGSASVAFGTGLNKGNPLDSLQWQSSLPAVRTLNVAEVTWLPDGDLLLDQPDDFILFTLGFTGLAAGTSPISIAVNAMAGHSEQNPNPPCPPCIQLPVALFPDSVTGAVATIPEPSILALAGIGLLSGLAVRRRKD